MLKLHPDELVRLVPRLMPVCASRARPGRRGSMRRTAGELNLDRTL